MGEGALTKEQLDAEMTEWIAWRKEQDAPSAKAMPARDVRPRNAALIKGIMVGIAPFIHDLEKQITTLQTRIEELERRPELKYLGVFKDDGRKYSEGSAVTHDGGIWIALKATTERPNHSADWQLAVKSGATPRSDAAAPANARNGSAGSLPANPRFR